MRLNRRATTQPRAHNETTTAVRTNAICNITGAQAVAEGDPIVSAMARLLEPAPAADASNPCLTCGACCAFYRASFYWAETDEALGTVPVELTEDLSDFRRAMKGTNQSAPRCIALEGEIGSDVRCTIYDLRSSTCREFPFSWQNGEPNERCDRPRIAWGLPPLPPAPLPGQSQNTPIVTAQADDGEARGQGSGVGGQGW